MRRTCPIDGDVLTAPDTAGDMGCPTCGRQWYEVEIDGLPSLASRPRNVVLLKAPQPGDKLDDVIQTRTKGGGDLITL